MSVAASGIDQLAERYWEAVLEADPLQATAIGERRFNDRLPDLSPAGVSGAARRFEQILAEASSIGADPADPEEALTLAALRQEAAARLADLRADYHSFSVDATWGLHSQLLTVATYQPLRDPDDGRAMLMRWQAMGTAIDQMIASLRRGLEGGRTPIRSSVQRTVEQLAEVLATPDVDGPLLAPLRQARPAGWADDDWRRFREGLAAAVADGVRPALARLHDFLAGEAVARGRGGEAAGIGNLPGGAETYRSAVAAHTTTALEAEAIHAIGLREVARIDDEMAELGARVLGAGSLAEVQAALRGDPALHFETGEGIEAVARASLARAEAAIPAWFGRLPRARCEVARMLPHEEKHSTIAYYREPAADGSRPGRYYVNTWQPDTRPRYEAEALAFHEAVPGHHLQLAISQELEALPSFRRHANMTAYVEGWGLYAERLAGEMGLYSGDLDRLGMLSYDAWRACRLVVDTGMHVLGWSHDRAVSFMVEHSALAPNNIVNEVERYLGRPGQALAYKIGQLEIMRLRGEASPAWITLRRARLPRRGAGPWPAAARRPGRVSGRRPRGPRRPLVVRVGGEVVHVRVVG